MRTRQLALLVCFFSSCLAIFSCRKEFNNIIQGREIASSDLLENTKVWYLQHLSIELSSPKLPPDWRGAWIIERLSGKMIIVPAPEKYIENTDFSIRRFFLFQVQGNNISDGRIVEFVGEKYDVEGNLDFLLENYDKNTITGFEGSILQYDINYSPLENTTYVKGKKVDGHSELRVGAINTESMRVLLSGVCTPIMPSSHGFPNPMCEDAEVLIYVQWVADEDGCLISLSYTYVSHSCPGGTGMGSGSGSGYSSGSGSGDDDTVPTYGGGGPSYDAVIKATIKDNPFALFEAIPCEILEKWINTARHTVAQDQIDKLNSIVNTIEVPTPGSLTPVISIEDVAKVQLIDDAYSTVVNLDYFPVAVHDLPIIDGTRATPDQFLRHIRKNINSFIDTTYSSFSPYNAYGVDDTQLWNSNNPIGAVVGIDIFGPDDGSVIVSRTSDEKWTFTTIYDPKYGEHPVSGNRDFGYVENNDGSYTFYVRGVDRLTSWEGTFAQWMSDQIGNEEVVPGPFTFADNLWESFQTIVENYVDNNGGNATALPSVIARPQWEVIEDVVNGTKPLSTLNEDCD